MTTPTRLDRKRIALAGALADLEIASLVTRPTKTRPSLSSFPGPLLSPNQKRVLALSAAGLDRQEIARQLHCSERDVTAIRGECLDLLHVRSISLAAIAALKLGELSLDDIPLKV